MKDFDTFCHFNMKHGGNNMILKEEGQLLKQYLLGDGLDENQINRIEERIFVDEDFYNALLHLEDELMEEYLDNSLVEREQTLFRERFLITKERRQNLSLIRNLRNYSVKETLGTSIRPTRFLWNLLPTFHPAQVAIIFLVAIGLAFGVWRVAIYETDTEKGISQLRLAYKGQRPFESRLTALPDYAAYSETRSLKPDNTDSASLDKAHRYLIDATSTSPGWQSHHALGVYYLANKDYERAKAEFLLAMAETSENSLLESDTGAANLEMAKIAIAKGEAAKGFELLNESLKHLNLAISIDPKLLEPLFNKALCLQALMDPEQAKIAWQEYLILDPDSAWAAEAQKNLKKLSEDPLHDRSAPQVESEFLTAYRQGNQETASSLLRSNRELIRGKYLPQRLASSFLNASSDSKDELLNAMYFAGQLEIKLTGDPFASHIAAFYSQVPESESIRLRNAQERIQAGYSQSIYREFHSARVSFQIAKKLFEQSGDQWEAKLAQYLLGYTLINDNENDLGLGELEQVTKFAADGKYLWLDATALHWIGGGYVNADEPGKAEEAYKEALAIAVRIDDSYSSQRNSIELASMYSHAGQVETSLEYLHRALSFSIHAQSSERQRYRGLIEAFVTLSRAKLFDAAIPQALEAVLISDRLADDAWKSQSRSFAGMAFAQTRDFENARKWMRQASDQAQVIKDLSVRNSEMAFCNLRSADIERLSGNWEIAERNYADAIGFYDFADMPLNREEAHKGLLMSLLASGDRDDLETQIVENIRVTEQFRSRILNEEERVSFFASRENFYDIAADFEFERGNYFRAYEYAEMSCARVLLDHIERGNRQKNGFLAIGDKLRFEAKNASLTEIQNQMPDGVQILQYSVLEEKLLIWVISKNTVYYVAVPVTASVLDAKIAEFREAIMERRMVQDPVLLNLGRELYDFLIEPIRDRLDTNNEICIIPSKILFRLPFSALILPDNNPLATEFRLLYSPSARVFLNASQSAHRKAGLPDESLLAIGNPTFDLEKFKGLSTLKDAETEVREISNFYPRARTLLNKDAKKKDFLREIARVEIVHFAGHYVVVPGRPSSSYLVMAASGNQEDDGIVTNVELANLHLPNVKLMVLAACQSGLDRVDNGEGMMGISRTTLAADIPLVVGSQWEVDSAATMSLMIQFHSFRKEHQLVSTAALQQAQLGLLSDATGMYNAPYYWAAFNVYGGHADF